MAVDGPDPSVRGVLGRAANRGRFQAPGAAAQAPRQHAVATAGHWRDQPEPVLLPARGMGSEHDVHARLDHADSGSVPTGRVARLVETAA
jgi:hypothetical protein